MGSIKRYGIPYRGSKSRIAGWVLDQLPPGDCLVDLFAGGCAVTHAAMEAGRYARYIANDIGDGPKVFRDAMRGEFDGFMLHVPTREEMQGSPDLATRVIYSFSNDCEGYLWGKDMEAVQRAASALILDPSVHGRRLAWRHLCQELGRYIADGGDPDRVKSKDDLQRQERLQSISGLGGDLTVYGVDYRDCPVPEGAVVYADPPYRGTRRGRKVDMRGYAGGYFDVAAFDRWLDEVPFMVCVSEVTCPDGCVLVAHTPLNHTCSSTRNDFFVEEGIYVQERFVGEWERLTGRVAEGTGVSPDAGQQEA